MEPLLTLKRPSTDSYDQCIICQQVKKDSVFNASDKGLATLQESANARQKLRDSEYREAIDRIADGLQAGHGKSFVWHKYCYAKFTDKGKIKRLQQKGNDNLPSTSGCQQSATPAGPSLRSSVPPMNWTYCMFCQNHNTREKLSAVTTFNVSQKILEFAKYDHPLFVRVSAISDLIAAEGKYHPNCYKRFLKNATKTKDDSRGTDLAMSWLIKELKYSAEQGHIHELSEVWNRYSTLSAEANTVIPQSYTTRLSTFKGKLHLCVNQDYDFVVLRDQATSERWTILVPMQFRHVPLSEVCDNEHSTSPIPQYKPQEDDFLSMVHVALKLRSDILAHPAYTGVNLSEEEAIDCVPDRLYMFIRLLLGGQSVLDIDKDDSPYTGGDEEAGDSDTETLRREQRIQSRVLSHAQDLIYSVCGGK